MATLNAVQFVQVAPTVDTSAYSAGEVVGGLLTIPIGANGGILRKVKLTDADSEGAALALYLFHSLPTAFDDTDAFAPTIDDLNSLIARVDFAADNYATVNSLDYVFATEDADGTVALTGIDCPTLDGNLYAYLVAVGTPTYAAADDLALEFVFWRNSV